MERRERRSPVGLVDSTRSWDSDNRVVWPSPIFAAFLKVVFEVLGLARTEIIPGTHDVSAMCVFIWIEWDIPQHVEHLSRMAPTAQDDE